MRGEAGVGKTALLDYVAERASGCRIVRVAGVQVEMELAFAGLHQLCAPMLDRLDALPGPQRDALSVAFGLAPGAAPDRFLVGLATLEPAGRRGRGAAAALPRRRRAVARRRVRPGAGVRRAAAAGGVGRAGLRRPRAEHAGDELAGLPELALEGLGDDDARALLESVVPGRLDERVRDRIVAETRGNPLALLELPRG